MSEKIFRGTGVALVTPFTANKEIDFTALEKLINHVIENGVDFLVALGTTAETPTLSKDEKIKLVHFIAEKNNKRVPLVCGLGGNNTEEVIKDFALYPMDKIDAILSVSPYYNKPSQEGIYQHFKAIDAASPVPIILYNVPGRTGSNMLASTSIRIAQNCKKVIAIKEAAGNMVQSMELAKGLPQGFTLLSGDDDLVMPQIACGFDGVISVAANCFTKDFCSMVNLSLEYKFSEARAIHYKLLEGIDLLFVEGNPAGVKCVLYEMNIVANECRLPVVPVSATTHQKIKDFLTKG
jgi:4-hydroxy-tetrahydrodipicolinate synthase